MYRLNVSGAALPLVPTVGRLRSLRYYLVMLWIDRCFVEITIYNTEEYPDVYMEAPMTMLRKGDGISPIDHRDITIFVASYRQSSGVYWHRFMPALLKWVHPDACGGLPERECLEAAFDAQADIEEALLLGLVTRMDTGQCGLSKILRHFRS